MSKVNQCTVCRYTASIQVADNSLTENYMKCPACGTKYGNGRRSMIYSKAHSVTYTPCITKPTSIVNFVLYTPHKLSIKQTCPICLQLIPNKELYSIVTRQEGVVDIFPSRLAHKDCVENFKGGNVNEVDVIPYYNVVEFLYKDYTRGRAYYKKYAHWFK